MLKLFSIYKCALQGSEEIFSVDPLPPKSPSVDDTSHSVSYVTHTLPQSTLSERDTGGEGDREEEEILPVDMDLEVTEATMLDE